MSLKPKTSKKKSSSKKSTKPKKKLNPYTTPKAKVRVDNKGNATFTWLYKMEGRRDFGNLKLVEIDRTRKSNQTLWPDRGSISVSGDFASTHAGIGEPEKDSGFKKTRKTFVSPNVDGTVTTSTWMVDAPSGKMTFESSSEGLRCPKIHFIFACGWAMGWTHKIIHTVKARNPEIYSHPDFEDWARVELEEHNKIRFGRE